MDYLVYAICAVVIFFGSFVSWFLWHGGLEPGPLATWLSGAASTCAVTVALWAQYRANKLRQEDQDDALAVAARRSLVSLYEVNAAAVKVRKSVRTGSKVRPILIAGEKVGNRWTIAVQKGFINGRVPVLAQGSEDLFARKNKIAELLDTRRLFDRISLISAAARGHEEVRQDLAKRVVKAKVGVSEPSRVSYDTSDAVTLRLLLKESEMVGHLQKLTDELLVDASKVVPVASEILHSWLPVGETIDISMLANAAESALEMPSLPVETPAEAIALEEVKAEIAQSTDKTLG